MTSSGVPGEIPFNLTTKYAMQQAIQQSLSVANRLANSVGVQSLDNSIDSPTLPGEDPKQPTKIPKNRQLPGMKLFPGISNQGPRTYNG